MRAILFQPEIPQNAGNIVRTCSVTGTALTLVKPLGFSLSNRRLKRAGLDYWEGVEVELIDDLFPYLEATEQPFYFFSSHASSRYTEIRFTKQDLLIFGSETSGIPERYWQRWPSHFHTIPMKRGARCINLASAVSIVLYEGLRQLDYEPL